MDKHQSFPSVMEAVVLVLTILGLQVGLGILTASLGLFGRSSLVNDPALLGIMNLIAFGFPLFWGVKRSGRPLKELFPLQPIRALLLVPIVLTILGLGILLSEADNWVRFVLPPPKWIVELFRNLSQGQTSFWGSLFVLVLVAPATEELMFRGLILRGLLNRYSTSKSIIVSSVLFAGVHLNPWQFLTATVLGLLFAWWSLQTQSLLPSLLGHALINGLPRAMVYLPFRIPGFQMGGDSAAVEFQPLWFDITGIILASLGVVLFWRLAHTPPQLPPEVDLSGTRETIVKRIEE